MPHLDISTFYKMILQNEDQSKTSETYRYSSIIRRMNEKVLKIIYQFSIRDRVVRCDIIYFHCLELHHPSHFLPIAFGICFLLSPDLRHVGDNYIF